MSTLLPKSALNVDSIVLRSLPTLFNLHLFCRPLLFGWNILRIKDCGASEADRHILLLMPIGREVAAKTAALTSVWRQRFWFLLDWDHAPALPQSKLLGKIWSDAVLLFER